MVQFGEAAAVVIWLHGICSYAAGHRDWDLMKEAAHTMCTWDGAWDHHLLVSRNRLPRPPVAPGMDDLLAATFDPAETLEPRMLSTIT